MHYKKIQIQKENLEFFIMRQNLLLKPHKVHVQILDRLQIVQGQVVYPFPFGRRKRRGEIELKENVDIQDIANSGLNVYLYTYTR